jgi:hypothetical protein
MLIRIMAGTFLISGIIAGWAQENGTSLVEENRLVLKPALYPDSPSVSADLRFRGAHPDPDRWSRSDHEYHGRRNLRRLGL